METLIFNNQEFKIREITLPKFGAVTISTNNLNEILFDEEDKYVSKEAETIDQQIFFFVKENEIDLDDFELAKIIQQEIK